ncbi:MAG: 3-dehydroquinate dehydratase [Desulfovibrio sp.]|nr:3-dehydroquinate dehydratase [Desulfovibrio sp.]
MNDPHSILIVNGPNLRHLGQRQPEIYGREGMDALPSLLDSLLGSRIALVSLSFFQTNEEGALLDRLEQARTEGIHGVVLNAGAYTHTSLALADCLAWIDLPVVEVHISNILARPEPLRRQSLIGPHVIGLIAGFGLLGYALAVQALLEHAASLSSSSSRIP